MKDQPDQSSTTSYWGSFWNAAASITNAATNAAVTVTNVAANSGTTVLNAAYQTVTAPVETATNAAKTSYQYAKSTYESTYDYLWPDVRKQLLVLGVEEKLLKNHFDSLNATLKVAIANKMAEKTDAAHIAILTLFSKLVEQEKRPVSPEAIKNTVDPMTALQKLQEQTYLSPMKKLNIFSNLSVSSEQENLLLRFLQKAQTILLHCGYLSEGQQEKWNGLVKNKNQALIVSALLVENLLTLDEIIFIHEKEKNFLMLDDGLQFLRKFANDDQARNFILFVLENDLLPYAELLNIEHFNIEQVDEWIDEKLNLREQNFFCEANKILGSNIKKYDELSQIDEHQLAFDIKTLQDDIDVLIHKDPLFEVEANNIKEFILQNMNTRCDELRKSKYNQKQEKLEEKKVIGEFIVLPTTQESTKLDKNESILSSIKNTAKKAGRKLKAEATQIQQVVKDDAKDFLTGLREEAEELVNEVEKLTIQKRKSR